MFEIERNELKG